MWEIILTIAFVVGLIVLFRAPSTSPLKRLMIRRDSTAAWYYRKGPDEPWKRLKNHEEVTGLDDYEGVSVLWPFRDDKPEYDKEHMRSVLEKYDEQLVSRIGGLAKMVSLQSRQ